MAFLIRTIDTTADGREIIRDRKVDKDVLTLGRAAEHDLHLPDLAVEQYHARIEQMAGGKIRVEAAGTLGFHIDGRISKSAQFPAQEGAELGLGSYRLLVSQGTDGPVTITISQTEGRTTSSSDALAGFSLGATLPGKRAMAWIALGVIMLAFLAVPIFTNLTRTPVPPAIDRPGQVKMDASWSSGPLSLAHHGLEDNCEACHVEPFQSVRDETCLSCHADIADHAAQPRQLAARGPMSTGDDIQWAIAHQFGKEGPGSCTTCHTEHEGAGRMQPTAQQFCSDCHGSLDTRLTDTAIGNAGDFGTAHPQFKALLFTAADQSKPARISLADQPREFSGLRFPHKMHLLPNGGVARMAGNLGTKNNYGAALVCADCHTPTADGSAFLPIRMEDDCEACHSLVYDKVGTTFRTLRHGDIDQMRADLAAMDRAPRVPAVSGIIPGRRRPGPFAQGGLYYQNFGRPAGSLVAINRALAKDGVCGECHIPTMTNGRADVLPVRLVDHYLVKSRFDHKAHKQEKCTTCHGANASENASDVLLPGIKTCRTCHMGAEDRSAEVPSSCAMCHSYHPANAKDHPPLPGKGKQGIGDKVALIGRADPAQRQLDRVW